ncbi:RDD family protein [Streptomyces sp. NBC_00239]|uniref:RDD family protein n=1 Tax=Streptomyces sp. NBC_00239 TaxID=2903640 RepID=UPI002E293AC3|nr:RDD family protein [Streptomyces sp. NBC_00239]
MSGLVTGDAVVLGVQPARLPSRALAIVIDMVVQWTVFLVVSMGLLAATGSLDGAAQTAVQITTFLLALVGVPIVIETLSRGRSLGKLMCGLRVVRDDGGPIRFRHALVRGALGVVELLMTFGTVACIASLVSARGRRLGDVFAGTLVVRERVPGGRNAYVPPPPPWLAGQFTELDLSAVPEGLWLAVRQYLTRMGQLDPHVSASMAARLGDDLVACTGTPAPPGIPAAAYLAAVVHERQSRDARRAFGQGGPFQPSHQAPHQVPVAGPAPGYGHAPHGQQAYGYAQPQAPGAYGMQQVPGQPAPAAPAVSDVPAAGRDGRDAQDTPSGAPATGFAPPS